jgi:hypothetical protein
VINENSSDEAKARYARFWGTLPVLPEQRAAQIAEQRRVLYDAPPPKQLSDYVSAPVRSKWLPRNGESDAAYTARLRGAGLVHLTEILPGAELKAVSEAHNRALERVEAGQSHDELRQQLDARTTGTVHGATTAQQRAQVLGNRFGGREMEHNGHILAPAVPGSVSLSVLARRPKPDNPLAVVRPAVPYGSSGEGWLGVDHG